MNRWAFLSEVVESLAFPELGHTGRPTPFQVVSSPSKKNNFIGVNIGETVLPWRWRTLSKTASSGCFFLIAVVRIQLFAVSKPLAGL